MSGPLPNISKISEDPIQQMEEEKKAAAIAAGAQVADD
jgi:hypothetical protein